MGTETAPPRPQQAARPSVPTWVSDAVALVFVVVATVAPDPARSPAPYKSVALTLVSLAVVAALLVLRRRFPFTALVGCVAIATFAPLWATSGLGFLLATAIAMFRVALASSRRTAVIAAVVSIIPLTVSAALNEGESWHYIVPSATIVALGAAAGDATRNRRAYIDAIIERARRAEETKELEAQQRVTEERLRIARELHDAAAHQIAAINLHAGVASNALPDHPADAERALEVIRSSARSVLTEISTLLRVLRTAPEPHAGAIADPVRSLDGLGDLLAEFERSGLRIDSEVSGDIAAVPSAVSVVGAKIIQEGLANALKHGRDSSAKLTVAVTRERLTITLENATRPGPGQALGDGGGHGLIGVRERVESVRGTSTVRTMEGRFILTAILPILPAGATAQDGGAE